MHIKSRYPELSEKYTDFIIPFESFWGSANKFSFLEAEDFTHRMKKKASRNSDGVLFLTEQNPVFCPICAKYGYHSVFHQIWLDSCFLHPSQPLIEQEEPENRIDFFSRFGSRAIDIFKNKNLRAEVESKICGNFDCIGLVDLNRYGFCNKQFTMYEPAVSCIYPPIYQSTGDTLLSLLRGEKIPSSAHVVADKISLEYSMGLQFEYLTERIPALMRSAEHGDIRCKDLELYIEWRENQRQKGKQLSTKALRENATDFVRQLLYEKYRELLTELAEYDISTTQEIDAFFNSVYEWDGLFPNIPIILKAKTIVLMLTAHYKSANLFESLADQSFPRVLTRSNPDQPYFKDCGSTIALLYHDLYSWNLFLSRNRVSLNDINMTGYESIIEKAIVCDLIEHSAGLLAEMIINGDVLDKPPIIKPFSGTFSLPISQYIYVVKDCRLSLYSCDPDIRSLTDRMYECAINGELQGWDRLTPRSKKQILAFNQRQKINGARSIYAPLIRDADSLSGFQNVI